MATIATALIVLVAAIHVYIVVLEMFLWRTPRGLQAFGTDQAFADASAPLAANQGLYNGFLVAGLIWGLVASEPVAFQVRIFFLACVIVAGRVRRRDRQPADPGGPGAAGGPGARGRARRGPGRGLTRAEAASASGARRSAARPCFSGPSQPVLRSGATLGATLASPKEPDMTRPLTPPPPAPAFDPDDDDRLIGRVLTRREVLALMGIASVGVVAAACAPASVASGAASAGSSATGTARHDGPGRIRGGGRELPAVLRRRARS